MQALHATFSLLLINTLINVTQMLCNKSSVIENLFKVLNRHVIFKVIITAKLSKGECNA